MIYTHPYVFYVNLPGAIDTRWTGIPTNTDSDTASEDPASVTRSANPRAIQNSNLVEYSLGDQKSGYSLTVWFFIFIYAIFWVP